MELGFDFDDRRGSAIPRQRLGKFAEPLVPDDGAGADGLGGISPDWSGIKARLRAVHALRRSLAELREGALAGGGFLLSGEQVLASCRPGPDAVNLICSANGKADSATTGVVAASPTPGDRGLQ